MISKAIQPSLEPKFSLVPDIRVMPRLVRNSSSMRVYSFPLLSVKVKEAERLLSLLFSSCELNKASITISFLHKMDFLHSMKIIVGDINALNILVETNGKDVIWGIGLWGCACGFRADRARRRR